MPVLYYHPMSTASRFVRLIFAEYGFQAELVEEQLWEKRKDFIALNRRARFLSMSTTICARCAARPSSRNSWTRHQGS